MSDAMTSIEISAHIREIIVCYFNDCSQIYRTTVVRKTYEIIGGDPQGSVLGMDLWNIMYDVLLRLALPRGARTVGFADDVAVIVVGKLLKEVT